MNPLLEDWTTPFGLPPFGAIATAISRRPSRRRSPRRGPTSTPSPADPAPPSFANTIEAMERAERDLDRVAAVFFNLAGADTNDAIEALAARSEPEARGAPFRDDDERARSSPGSTR